MDEAERELSPVVEELLLRLDQLLLDAQDLKASARHHTLPHAALAAIHKV